MSPGRLTLQGTVRWSQMPLQPYLSLLLLSNSASICDLLVVVLLHGLHELFRNSSFLNAAMHLYSFLPSDEASSLDDGLSQMCGT